MIPETFGLARFRFELQGDVETMVTTVGVKYPTLSPGVWAASLDSQIRTSGVVLAANMYTVWTYSGVSLSYMTASGLVEYESAGAAVVGLVSPTALPSNCAVLIKKRTESGGRAHRGRFYCPMISTGEGQVDHNGNLTTGHRAILQGQWTSFLDGVEGAEGELYVLHADPLLEPTRITALEVQGKIATQRRRMR